MPAILITIGKWIVTSVVLPLIEKWVAAFIKAREKITKINQTSKENKAKEVKYEKDPSDDNFSDLP